MEGTILETLFLPWWRGILSFLALGVGLGIPIVACKININFDVNAWSKTRQERKDKDRHLKLVEKCKRHLWEMNTPGPYSRCIRCLGVILTAELALAEQIGPPTPTIVNRNNVTFRPEVGTLLAADAFGRDKQ